MNPEIFIIRHGEPEGGKRYRGDAIDDPLNQQGWQQMENAIQGLETWDIIISSPLKRCRVFAEHIAQHQTINCIIDKDLREMGFGHWEGLAHKEIETRFPEEFLKFQENPLNTPHSAENLVDFQNRVLKAYQTIRTTYLHKKILIVSHSGVMRIIALEHLKAPLTSWYNFEIPYAGILWIKPHKSGHDRISWYANTG